MSAYRELVERINGTVELVENTDGSASVTVKSTFMNDGDAIITNKYKADSKKYVDVSVTNSDNEQNGFHALAPGQQFSIIKKWSTNHPDAYASLMIREQTAGDNPPPPPPSDDDKNAIMYEYIVAALILILVAVVILYLAFRR